MSTTHFKKTGIKGAELLDYPLGTKFKLPEEVNRYYCYRCRRRKNKEKVEGLISSIIIDDYPNWPPTETQFKELEEVAANIRQCIEPFTPISDDDFADIMRTLKARI